VYVHSRVANARKKTMNVRKIKNTSETDIAVQVDERTTIVIKPGMELKDMNVRNMDSIRKFVDVEYDLSEINPIREGRQQLNG
jgi:hypothetical protein